MDIPAAYMARLAEVTRPSHTERTHAKMVILELLNGGAPLRRDALLDAVRLRCMGAIPAPLHDDRVDLPSVVNISVIQPDRPVFAYQRCYEAAVEGLAELEANGVLLPATTSSRISVHVRFGSESGAVPIGSPGPSIAGDAYLLPEAHRLTDHILLDSAIYAQGIEAILGDRGTQCLEEAVNAHRRGLELAAINMLGAASEAAWYVIAERVLPSVPALTKAMAGTSTITVIRLVSDYMMGIKGVSVEGVREVQAHAGYLRDLRNYGMHPRGTNAAQQHFSSEAAGLIFLQTHRYFGRLAEAAEKVP